LKGSPIEDGCLLDRLTAAEGFPEFLWSALVDKYQTAGQVIFKAAFNAARGVKTKQLEEDGGDEDFKPRSRVSHLTTCGYDVYYEVGLLSEGEFIRLTGLPPKDLKAKVFKFKQEDGEPLTAYLISLRDLEAGAVASIRKMKIWHKYCIEHDEIMLDSNRQLHQDQGNSVSGS
jgi:hypothetical protein